MTLNVLPSEIDFPLTAHAYNLIWKADKEIQQLIEFYESPIGKKQSRIMLKFGEFIKSLTPKLEKRMMEEWFPIILRNLEKRGFDKLGN